MICNKLIPLDKPYQYTSRHDWIGAAIGAASSILGNVLGSSSQNSTNQTNIRIAKMNNAANQDLAYLQNSLNVEQWNRENRYNDPSQQRARLEAAGLNPYLMMNGGSAGNASSMTPSSLASSNNTPSVQPYNYDFSGISQSYMQDQLNTAMIRKTNAEAAGQEKQNQWIDAKTQAEVNNILQNTEYQKGNTYLNQVRSNLENFNLQRSKMLLVGDLANQDLQNQQLSESIVNTRANTLFTSMQASLADANLKWLPKEKEAQLAQYSAQTFAAIESGKLSIQQGKAAVASALLSTAQAHGQNLNNKVLRSSVNFAVNKMYWDSQKSKFDANTSYWSSRHAKANSGPDDLFKMVNGNNGYSGSGAGWFNFLEGLRRFVPFTK